jgi:hypothetical protein
MPQNVPSCGKLYSDYRTTDRENLTRHLIFAPVHVEHPVKMWRRRYTGNKRDELGDELGEPGRPPPMIFTRSTVNDFP